MTLATSTNFVEYVGNGVTKVFPYSFRVDNANDFVLTRITIASGVVTPILGSEFSYTGIGVDGGGNITYPLVGSAMSSLFRLRIERIVPVTQDLDISNQSPFFPNVLEAQLDRMVMMLQQINTQAAAVNSVAWANITGKPTTLAGFGITDAQPLNTLLTNLAAVVTAANTAIFYTALNTPVVYTLSPYARTILDDVDAATAQATLGLGTLATQSGTFSGDSSGTNTGDQTITLNGDVTGSGTGTFSTSIAANSVTNAKMADMASQTIRGRLTAGAGDPEDLTKTQAQTLLNVADGANNYVHPNHTGDVTSVGDGSTTISANVVTKAKMEDVATATIRGRITAGTGDPEDLTSTQVTSMMDVFTGTLKGLAPLSGGGTSNFLRADGTWAAPPTGTVSDADKGDITVSGSGTVWSIDNNVVTYAKMQDVSATSRFIGRVTAGAGDPEELTGTQATSLLNVFTDTLKGLVPLSGGGTVNFLRADGTFAAPPGAAGGETNTASNVGTAGVGIWKDKVGVDLRFKKINAGSSKVTITDDTGNNEVDVDVVEANLTLGSMGGSIDLSTARASGVLAAARFPALTGDVTTVAGALAATIAANVVTYAKMQDVSATDKLIGRSTAGAGDPEEITCTAAGRALIDDADAAAQRATLSLGNVDNTSDVNKPVSTAQAAAIATVPENAQTGTTYTLVLTDAGKMVSMSNASAITLTVPTNASVAFPVNTRIDLLQLGAGQVTVSPTGITLQSSGSKQKLTGQYSGATLWKKATDTWVLIGDIAT